MRNPLFAVIVLSAVGVALVVSWQAQASEIWSTLPGTDAPDELKAIQRGEQIYTVLPGTRTPDWGSNERKIIRGNKIYDVIPGTNVPDYGSRKYIIK